MTILLQNEIRDFLQRAPRRNWCFVGDRRWCNKMSSTPATPEFLTG